MQGVEQQGTHICSRFACCCMRHACCVLLCCCCCFGDGAARGGMLCSFQKDMQKPLWLTCFLTRVTLMLIWQPCVSRIVPIDVHSFSTHFSLHTVVFAGLSRGSPASFAAVEAVRFCQPTHTTQAHARLNVECHTTHPGRVHARNNAGSRLANARHQQANSQQAQQSARMAQRPCWQGVLALSCVHKVSPHPSDIHVGLALQATACS